MIKLSIIVPVYNTEKYLTHCLDTLVSQTLNDYEVIIINDGSPDNSQKIIDKYAKKYPKIIRFKKIPNGGVGNARNVGIKMAKGEYIAFLDSDDYVGKDTYQKLYNKAKDTKSDIVTCGYYGVNVNWMKERRCKPNDLFGYNIIEHPSTFRGTVPLCWAHIFKRTIIEKNNITFTDHKMYEDLLFTYKCYKHANKIEKIYEPLVYYVIREDGSSVTQGFKEANFCIFDVMNQLSDYYGESIPKEWITYIALKHIMLRVKRKIRLRDFFIKRRFIKEGFSFLDNFDSDWKHNLYFENTKNKRIFYKNYWLFITLFKGKEK